MLLTPKLLASTAILLVAAITLSVTTVAAQEEPADFRGEGEGEWYHPLELEEWAELGADPAILEALIERIGASTGPRVYAEMPDTQIAFDAGNWAYEWTRAGDVALENARGAANDSEALASAQLPLPPRVVPPLTVNRRQAARPPTK